MSSRRHILGQHEGYSYLSDVPSSLRNTQLREYKLRTLKCSVEHCEVKIYYGCSKLLIFNILKLIDVIFRYFCITFLDWMKKKSVKIILTNRRHPSCNSLLQQLSVVPPRAGAFDRNNRKHLSRSVQTVSSRSLPQPYRQHPLSVILYNSRCSSGIGQLIKWIIKVVERIAVNYSVLSGSRSVFDACCSPVGLCLSGLCMMLAKIRRNFCHHFTIICFLFWRRADNVSG